MSPPRRQNHARPGEGGYALVSVVWLVGILAVAVATMSVYSVNSLAVMATGADRATAEAITRGGLEYAVSRLAMGEQKEPARGKLSRRIGPGVARATWMGETARIDLNQAAPALISNLMTRYASDDAHLFTDMILRRRPQTNNGGGQNGAGAQGSPGAPPGQPGAPPGFPGGGPLGQLAGQPQGQAANGAPAPTAFRHMRELVVAGLPASLVARITPYVTLYAGIERIDPRLAPRDVLALLPDITEARLRGILELRGRRDAKPEDWQREAGSAAAFLTLDRGATVRVRVDAILDNGFRAAAEAVVAMYQDDREPWRALAWDDSPPDPVADPDGDSP